MIYNDDLMRLRNSEVTALRSEIKRLKSKIEFLEAKIEVARDVTFNN